MSLIIKGMGMPNLGVDVMIYPDGRVVEFLGYGKKRLMGTAVPLPEKHGRLIDADALFKHLFLTDGGYIANDRDSDGWPHVCTYESIKKAIHEAPTIIEVEGGGTTTLDELCKAIHLIRDTCAKTYQDKQKGCSDCVLDSYCRRNHNFGVPCEDWGDPAEGGGEDG